MFKQILILTILAMFLTSVMVPFDDAHSVKPIIIFDKPTYNPFATMKILIVDPASNFNRENIDVAQAVVYTRSNVGNSFEFTEVAPDAGVFETLVRLTPNQNEWPADLVVQKDDEVFVQFSSQSGSSTSGVHVDFSTSAVIFDKVQYALDQPVRLFVLDIDENKVPNAIDTVQITAWSTTDIKGLTVTLKEIATNIGIFSGTVSLVKDQPSSGTVLKVTSKDVITVKYTDKTLPPPAKQDQQPEVKDLFAAALVEEKKSPVDLKPPSIPEIVDQLGNRLDDIRLGQVIIIQDDVVNTRDTNQKFAYIVLIKDRDGITVSLSWITGELQPSVTFKASQSWIPEEPGLYEIEVFLWQSIENPVPLAPQKTVAITVTHPLE